VSIGILTILTSPVKFLEY